MFYTETTTEATTTTTKKTTTNICTRDMMTLYCRDLYLSYDSHDSFSLNLMQRSAFSSLSYFYHCTAIFFRIINESSNTSTDAASIRKQTTPLTNSAGKRGTPHSILCTGMSTSRTQMDCHISLSRNTTNTKPCPNVQIAGHLTCTAIFRNRCACHVIQKPATFLR